MISEICDAERVQSGIVPTIAVLRRMSDEDIVARLTAVRGIGRRTVEMLLILRLGRRTFFQLIAPIFP